MSIRLDDDREYAWLLVRSDALVRELVKVWQFVPIRSGSVLARLIGYPLRLVVFVATMLFVLAWALLILVPLVQLPVALFAYVHRFLPDWLWLTVLIGSAVALVGTLAAGIRGSGATPLRDAVAAPGAATAPEPAPVAEDGASAPAAKAGWNRWDSLNAGHESSRSALVASMAIILGMVLQCLAVTLGPTLFAGRIDTGWQWPLLFSERLLNTLMLGMTAGLVPTFSDIRPAAAGGQLLLTGVDLWFVSGAIAMMVRTIPPAFRRRELFRGTTRNLADHLENFDIARGDRLTIHRVGVVRPLDEKEVVTLTKEEFFATLVKP